MAKPRFVYLGMNKLLSLRLGGPVSRDDNSVTLMYGPIELFDFNIFRHDVGDDIFLSLYDKFKCGKLDEVKESLDTYGNQGKRGLSTRYIKLEILNPTHHKRPSKSNLLHFSYISILDKKQKQQEDLKSKDVVIYSNHPNQLRMANRPFRMKIEDEYMYLEYLKALQKEDKNIIEFLIDSFISGEADIIKTLKSRHSMVSYEFHSFISLYLTKYVK